MRLLNYENAEIIDKKEWLNSLKMEIGLKYFGGKSIIGRYIFNNIFNLAVAMKKNGDKPDIFIDAFTGGGKIGLSVPDGWFDTIVINDLNYGVYSYYKCCQENPVALLYMIEDLGDRMSKEFFHVAAYVRNFGLNVDMWGDMTQYVSKKEEMNSLVAGAMTYWVTSAAYNGMTDPDTTTYNFTKLVGEDKKEDKAFERANIEKTISRAYKRIPKLHEKLNSQHYIIENLDYRDLIKKYNGKMYTEIKRDEATQYHRSVHKRYRTYRKEQREKLISIREAIPLYASKNKLWYFDPPYCQYCLYAGKDAPYADTFSIEMTQEMTKILHGDFKNTYGEIKYFIKSDYDPKESYDRALKDDKDSWYKQLIAMENGYNTIAKLMIKRSIEKHNANTSDKTIVAEIRKRYDYEKPWYPKMITGIFNSLEKYPFRKICVGSFDKGTVDITGEKTVGQEYIWCRGLPKEEEEIILDTAKD